MLLLLGVAMYFIMVRKNTFEERLMLYRPQHQLSQKREAYLKGVRKFRLWVAGIIIVMFTAPLFFYIVIIMQEGVEVLPFLFPDETIGSILIVFLVYYLLYYVLKRNEKAMRMLLEQMSDSDFDLLLKIKGVCSFSLAIVRRLCCVTSNCTSLFSMQFVKLTLLKSRI